MEPVASIEIPQEILDSARLSAHDTKVELAISLYVQGRLSVGKAKELANMSLWEFRQLLVSREIVSHYDENELKNEIATLKELRRI